VNWFTRFFFGRNVKERTARRGFDGAKTSRLQSGWGSDAPYDRDILASLALLRARSRDLAQNNDYVKRFLALINTHVVGPKGIQLRCAFKVQGEIDQQVNDEIEEQFRRWGKKGTCDVTGRLSWRDVQRLMLQGVARDGEALVRFVYGERYPFGMALQVIDPALLDETLSDSKGARVISMGVELSEWGKPTAYYFKTSDREKGEAIAGRHYRRIPADEILHVFMQDMPQQTRGVPWIHTAMSRLKMLGGYEESEMVAARVASSKMGFFKQTGGSTYAGEDLKPDEDGNVITKAEPGSFELLPEGVEFQPWDPEHPAGNFAPFVKACLRGISAGLGISYNSLANDVESVSYSSLRSSLLEERDHYVCLQNWLVENLCEEVYRKWLTGAVLSKRFTKITTINMDRFDSPQFVARRWAWVDPLKDTKANILALQAGLKSRTEIISEQGRSVEDVFSEIVAEKAKAEKFGLSFGEDSEEDTGAEDPAEATESSEQYLS
jgi:lambda family phage portal protein